MDGYRVEVRVFAPGGGDEPISVASVMLDAARVAATSDEGLTAFYCGYFNAIAGDVAEIVKGHAGEGA